MVDYRMLEERKGKLYHYGGFVYGFVSSAT